MSFRDRDDGSGGNPNKMDLGESRRFGGMDNDKPMRDDPDDRMSRFDSNRGRRPPFGRGRRPSPGREKSYGDRSRDFGYGRDEPMMRDRSPMHGSDDRYSDRFKKEDSSFSKRDEHRKEPGGRSYYGDDSHRDRFMGMEGRSRHEGHGNFNSRFEGPNDQFKQRPPMNFPTPPPKGYFGDGFPKPNECEIIAVNKQQRAYAESVEARVKNLGILVDVLFLKDEALLTQTIDDIARRGSLYAMVINPQNETHGSVTVNILHGTPQEHRNMPLEDALKLVSRNFHEHIRMQKEHMDRERAERGPYVGVVSADREIQFLLRMLADGRWISLSEIDTVIRYLCERRDKMQGTPDDRGHGRLPVPSGDIKIEPSFKPKDDPDVSKKEQDLQNRIINIMNQGAPPAVGLGNTQVPNMNQGPLPNVDRPNQPRLSPSMNNMRPQPGMGPNIPGIKPARPGLEDNVPSQPGLEPNLAVPEVSNQAAFTTASGTTLPSDPATTPTYINFDNPSVKKALDNLIQSGPNILKNLGSSLSSSGISNPQNMPAKSASSSAAGMGPPMDHIGINSQTSRGNMGPPRGPVGMGDMGGSGPGRNSGNLDMGPPRGAGIMGDIGVPASQRGSGNVSDMGMGSQRGGFGGMSDMGGMNSQRGFGNMPEGGMGSQRMPGSMQEMGRMGGPQRGGGGMGPPQGQEMGRGPHGMGPSGNFPGQNQFGKYQAPGQQGNFSGSFNSGPNMQRQNYGGPQGMGGMGGGPRRY